MSFFFAILIDGLVSGGIYAVLAAGFALIFGVARVTNFAYTAFYMIAAYVLYTFSEMLGFHPVLGAVVAIVTVTTVAVCFHVLCIDRVKVHDIAVMMITVAFAIIIQECILIKFGGVYLGVKPFVRGSIELLGVDITYQHIFSIAASLAALGSIWTLLSRTSLGNAILAISQDKEVATLMGMDVGKIILITVAISAAFAGFAGVIVAPIFTISPFIWMSPLVIILAAVVIGGLGSLKGSIIGAFILGFAQAATVILVPVGSYLKEMVALAVMVLVLVVRSEGLFGVVFEEEKL